MLHLPKGAGPHPAILLIHGDGAAPWNQYGYYAPIREAFLAAGFATLSWDKPGVGGSTGDWLSQSMSDRAGEAVEAARALKSRTDIRKDAVGLWGVSQAGWVMPIAISETSEFAFMISVSGAINWFRQGAYMTENRMRGAGYSEGEIAKARAFEEEEQGRFENDESYQDYLSRMQDTPPWAEGIISADRWRFARRNASSDVVDTLRRVHVPVLAIFGDMDLNVDFAESANIYRRVLATGGNEDVTIKVFENADHGLMKAKIPRMSDDSVLRGLLLLLKIEFLGKRAFAPGYVDMMADWASERFGRNGIR